MTMKAFDAMRLEPVEDETVERVRQVRQREDANVRCSPAAPRVWNVCETIRAFSTSG